MENLPVVASSNRPKPARRKLIILPEFQYWLVGVNFVVIVCVSAVIWLGMMSALKELKPAAGLSGFQVDYYRNYLNYQVRTFQISLFFSLLVGGLISLTQPSSSPIV